MAVSDVLAETIHAQGGKEPDQAINQVLSELAKKTSVGTPQMAFLPASADSRWLDAVVLWPDQAPILADISVKFEWLGLRLVDYTPLATNGKLDPAAKLHRFRFQMPEGKWNSATEELVTETFAAGHDGRFSIDRYCTLTLRGGLSWRDILLIRSMSRFVRQTEPVCSEPYLIDTLNCHTEFAATLVRLFTAKFDPAVDDREKLVAGLRDRLAELLDAARTLDEDRALRALLCAVDATLRTNWFQRSDNGSIKSYVSFKFDSSLLSNPGVITPYREIFVCNDSMEGVHLRGGPVARGGLRFSDRPESYRAEALELLKTQIVKNAPIVPVGAKGTFVRLSDSVSPTDVYTTFVKGLLEITDNLVDGESEPPPDTVIYDGADSYLVVAADKGTARMSDTANGVATQASFWLGDAFASGGSAGYDHKAMGITARGAWGAVTRHFVELGIDVNADPISTVGIGDMSGDVFGNGMLLSRTIRLVAAFDHRHIFCDPDPDPETSFEERQRLFELSGPSSWEDYRHDVISTGGGIWPRDAKRIELSASLRAALGTDREWLSGPDLVKAILRAPVDLLWNGGIGTYVKASTEGDSQAADPTNDATRIDADELRCRVVGEGGNLGFTQRARVQYALNGGRINGDFIDNAAGVSTSDREVNLKIALEPAVSSGAMSLQERNRLLAECSEPVAQAVLTDCGNQTLAISVAETRAPALVSRHERLVENLESQSGLDRSTAGLPGPKELAARARAGQGLVRPEVAMLLAHSKNLVRVELLESDVLESPAFTTLLTGYFPESVRQCSPDGVAHHRLAREIIATELASRLVNHVGPGFLYRLEERLGTEIASTPQVAGAYTVVHAAFSVDDLWSRATALCDADPTSPPRHLVSVQVLIEKAISWVLRHRPHPLDLVGEIQRYGEPVTRLLEARPVFGADRATLAPPILSQVFGLVDIAIEREVPITWVSEGYFAIAELLDLPWVLDGIEQATLAGYWESMAAATVRDELAEKLCRLVDVVLARAGDTVPIPELVQSWQEQHAAALVRLPEMIVEIRNTGPIDIAHACTISGELDRIINVSNARTHSTGAG